MLFFTNRNDFIFLVPPLLAKPSLFTNNNNNKANTLKKLPNGGKNAIVNGQRDAHDYEPGHATEMLSQSVQKLNIADATVDDFKTQAGKIITTMLENRLNEKNALNGTGKANKLIVNGNSKSSAPLCDKVKIPPLPPLLPTTKPFAKLTPIIPIADTNTDKMPLSPTHSLTDLPLPPPPAELIISSATIADATDYDAIDRKTISDINDNDILLTDDDHVPNKQCLDDTVSAVKILPQHQHHQHQHHHQQYQQNGRNNGVVLRNKNTKAESSSHARDRRSYIGQDQCTPNRFNHNNHLITSHTTEIASDLRDGKHPICSVCHVKITRYAICPRASIFL